MKVILIIDNDTPQGFITILKADGFSVDHVTSGKEGIEKAKATKPDVILLGQMLPDMEGNDVLKLLKEDPATKNIPVAILSNFGNQERVSEAMQLGAYEYILKYQISAEDLAKRVTSLISSTSSIAKTS